MALCAALSLLIVLVIPITPTILRLAGTPEVFVSLGSTYFSITLIGIIIQFVTTIYISCERCRGRSRKILALNMSVVLIKLALTALFVYVLDASGNRRAKLGDPADQAELRRLVLARGAEIESRILHEKPVDPIIYDEDVDEDDPAGEMAALAPFADGFAFACSLWPELMKSQDKAVQAALVGILRHESSDDEEDDEQESSEENAASEVRFASLDEALEDVEACVQEIAEVTRKGDIKKAPSKKPGFAKKARR